MLLLSLSEYINANAPMSNLPELLSLHHSNPLGLHPIAIPILLLVLAVAMHVTTYRIIKYDKRNLYPLLYTLVGLAIVSTYYYCFSDDLPLFEDVDLHRKEISVGWFCQRDIVGLGWSLLGELLLTYVVYSFMTSLMQLVGKLSDAMADVFAPITGVWIMLVYQTVMVLMIVAKTVHDIVGTHKPWRCLFVGLCFLVGIEAVTMLAVECIEGNIYFFIPVVFIFTTVHVRYKKKQGK